MITVPLPSFLAKQTRAIHRPWIRFALPLITISLLVGILGSFAYHYLSEEIRRDNQRTLAVIAEQKKQQIEGSLAEIQIDTKLFLSGNSHLERLFGQWLDGQRHDGALIEQMRLQMKEVVKVRGWAGLALLDSAGLPAVVVGDADSREYAALIQDVLRRPRVELVDLHFNAQGEPIYGVLAPIGLADSAPLGVAYLTVKAEQSLYPLVQSWPVPTQTAETYLVRRDGDSVRFLTPLRFRHERTLTLTRPLSTPKMPAARAIRGEHGIIAGGRDYRSIPVLAYSAPVAGTPWLMIAEIDEDEAYASIDTLTWSVALTIGLGLLLVYTSAYLLWRRERQRQEFVALQAQRAAEARFRVVFEQAPLGVALIDSRNGHIVEANHRYADIVGRPADALAGLDPMSITHPDDVQKSRDNMARLIANDLSGGPLSKRYLRPDGTEVWIRLTSAPLQVDTEQAPLCLVIAEDITARRQMEERLRISEERHRLLADNAIDVILTMDLEGRISYVSPSVEKLRGYSVEEVMQQSLDAMLTSDSLALVEGYLRHLNENVRTGRAPESFRGELEYRRKDGTTVWTDVTASPLLGADGRFIEILGVARDISEQRRYERELQQAYDAAEAANAAKSEFLAHMSHEIRTPMNAVLGLAQVLERETLAAPHREMVERIRIAGQSLLTILNDVLDLSKIEAGQLRIEPRPFDLGILLANLDSLMGQAARAKGLALRIYEPASPLGFLLGDGLRLEQVLLNLTGNAIKFTDSGEVAVLVQVRENNESGVRLRFEVRDSGIGIAPEALAKLFAPFTQAESGISRRFGGTGLGLSICKRLLELLGGEIGAQSKIGQGSTFWFELPLQHASEHEIVAQPPAAPTPQSCAPRMVGAHFLVVDDSAMNRDLVERALKQEGATATLAADGQQAVQLLSSRPYGFDAVLMDVQMPVMDGLTATRMIREELGLRDLPIIAFTAGVRDEQQAAARAAGADDVLPKPMDLEQMTVLLSRWITPAPTSVAITADIPPAPTVTTEDESFPEIAGIDRDKAAKRLGRDREIFLGLLKMLVDEFADAATQTREDLAHGRVESASRRMHTLRSNAGFVCALDLMESAGEVEAAIDKDHKELDVLVNEMERKLSELVTASAPWRQ